MRSRRSSASLDERNQSAAGSLAEDLDETLTLHRLGVYGRCWARSFKTTNCLDVCQCAGRGTVREGRSLADLELQRHRWLATALLGHRTIVLRKVMGYRHLSTLRDALKRELKIDTTSIEVRGAASSNQGAVESFN